MTDPPRQLTDALAGRYTLERELGAGGMATVYLAEDARHHRKVAIKVLHPELSAVLGPERFLKEIELTANLQHPHILPLFDSGAADGLLYYVMPYVDGESLRSRLDRERQLPVAEAVRIATEVADALAYAHARGIIHRDIKPDNILLQNGHALVADFGIALAVMEAGGQRMTQTGLSLGTPAYMAPEQAMAEPGVDRRADVYALGAVTYEMLAGQAPFTGPTAQAVIAQVLTADPPPLGTRRRSVPPHVETAVHAALEKLPADRVATAQEFAAMLGGRVTGLAPVRARPPWRDALRLPLTRVLLAALAVAIAALALREATRAGTGDRATNRERTPVRFRLTFDDGVTWVDHGVGSPAALSPDGTRLVFIGRNAAGTERLYLRPLDRLSATPLSGTEEALLPFWSPDGRWVGFVSGTQLKKIPVEGGTPVLIADLAQAPQGASWGGGDRIVAATGGRLHLVTGPDAAPRPVTSSDTAPELVERWPLVLPDGETVLYSQWSGSNVAGARIAAASLPEGTRAVLDLPGTHPLGVVDGHLVYTAAAGAIMAVPFDARARRVTGTPIPVIDNVGVGGAGGARGSVSPSGSVVYVSGSALTSHLMTGSPGAPPRLLLPDERAYAFPRVSPDGEHVAFTVFRDRAEIWIYDLPSGPLRRLAFEGSVNDRPEWTPDSRQVLFRSNRSGINAIWTQPADGSRPAALLFSYPPHAVDEGVLSADGEYLVMQLDSAGSGGVVAYRRLRGDTAVRAIGRPRTGQQAHPRPSPDGRWIAYASSESGTWNVYVTPFPAGDARHQISLSGGSQPVWSRDGRRLFYLIGGRLVAATLAFEPFTVLRRDTLMTDVGDPPPGSGAFTFYHANYDVMPDGESFVFLNPAANDPEVIVVYDWKLELRRGSGSP